MTAFDGARQHEDPGLPPLAHPERLQIAVPQPAHRARLTILEAAAVGVVSIAALVGLALVAL